MYLISGLADFGPNDKRQFESIVRGSRIAQFQGQYVSKNYLASLPEDMFAWDGRVRDEVVYIWQEGSLVREARSITESALPKPDCLVVVLESPHRSEYCCKQGFKPIGPLRDKNSRARFVKYLPALITQDIGDVPNGTEIVLSNPVPYQTSLDRLMVGEAGIHEPIRNSVWKTLFREGFKEDFQSRIVRYQPRIIINACTYPLKLTLEKALCELVREKKLKGCHLFTSNRHPCIWHSKPSLRQVCDRAAGDKRKT